jgi:hypothetical protein
MINPIRPKLNYLLKYFSQKPRNIIKGDFSFAYDHNSADPNNQKRDKWFSPAWQNALAKKKDEKMKKEDFKMKLLNPVVEKKTVEPVEDPLFG